MARSSTSRFRFPCHSALPGPHPLAPLGLSYWSVYFPASFVAAHGYAHLVETTRKWASVLKAAHGTAGYSVLLEQGEFGAGGVMALMPALKRFPGLDFPIRECFW